MCVLSLLCTCTYQCVLCVCTCICLLSSLSPSLPLPLPSLFPSLSPSPSPLTLPLSFPLSLSPYLPSFLPSLSPSLSPSPSPLTLFPPSYLALCRVSCVNWQKVGPLALCIVHVHTFCRCIDTLIKGHSQYRTHNSLSTKDTLRVPNIHFAILLIQSMYSCNL